MTTGQGLEARPQLLTYPDSLGGDLRTLAGLLEGPLAGLFRGVHILPPFPSSGDRGFAPVTYDRDRSAFRELGRHGAHRGRPRRAARRDDQPHLASRAPSSRTSNGSVGDSPSADLFLTLDKVWPGGEPRDEDVAQIFLRKPGGPFSTVTIEETGKPERIWTSFGSADWSEQIDLDVNASATRALITGWLGSLASHGVRIVRLDAVGYVIKKPGTTCFMVEPEIYEFLGVGDRRRRDDGPRRAARGP